MQCGIGAYPLRYCGGIRFCRGLEVPSVQQYVRRTLRADYRHPPRLTTSNFRHDLTSKYSGGSNAVFWKATRKYGHWGEIPSEPDPKSLNDGPGGQCGNVFYDNYWVFAQLATESMVIRTGQQRNGDDQRALSVNTVPTDTTPSELLVPTPWARVRTTNDVPKNGEEKPTNKLNSQKTTVAVDLMIARFCGGKSWSEQQAEARAANRRLVIKPGPNMDGVPLPRQQFIGSGQDVKGVDTFYSRVATYAIAAKRNKLRIALWKRVPQEIIWTRDNGNASVESSTGPLEFDLETRVTETFYLISFHFDIYIANNYSCKIVIICFIIVYLLRFVVIWVDRRNMCSLYTAYEINKK